MKYIVMLTIAVLALSMFAGIGMAIPTEPTGPQNLTRLSDSRFDQNNWPSLSLEAEAGNITEISLYALTQTQTWQGFYGEISGMIVLDDANNYTFYDWYMAEPQGEIYASNATIADWSTVRCVNYTNNGTYINVSYDGGSKNTIDLNPLNLSQIETNYNLLSNDYDGFDETFNVTGDLYGGTAHSQFYVGTTEIASGSCPATSTYKTVCVNRSSSSYEHLQETVAFYFCNGSFTDFKYQLDGRAQGEDFQEVLLTLNNSHTLIFATIIENAEGVNNTDVMGYNNKTHDFQMLVVDDGHAGAQQDLTTTYWFYVELE